MELLLLKSGTMNKTLKYSSIIFLLSSLAGCNTMGSLYDKQHVVYNREYDYLQSYSVQPLVVPPGVDSSQLGNKFIIPGNEYPAQLQRTSLVPPGSMEDLVARGQLPASIIKSDQIPNMPLPSTSADNTEMQAYEVQSPSATPSLTPELASTAVQPTNHPTTHPTTAMQTTRATIAAANPEAGLINTKSINYPQLTVAQPVNQLWNKLGPVLQKSGYKVLLQDKRVNIYYILDLSATQGKILKSTPMYQIHLNSINNNTSSLTVTDNNGAQTDNKTAQRILDTIHWNLA